MNTHHGTRLGWLGLAAAALLAAGAPGARAAGNSITDEGVPLVTNGPLDINVFGRAQMIGVGEYVPDPVRDNQRVYLFLKQARLGFRGSYKDLFTYETQFAFGGEDANGSNTDLSLLDFVADVPLKPLGDGVALKVGQFRVPFGRENLTDRGYMDFGDRSIASMATYQGRDYGLALLARRGPWTGTVGTFSAGGRDVPQRYLPERVGIPELVARVGYDDGVDQDVYHVVGEDRDLTRTTKAAYLSALYTHDTQIGHSTPLLVHTIDKNLLIDTNYNPYLNEGGPGGDTNAGYGGHSVGSADALQRGDMWDLGADAVVRHPLGGGRAVEGEVEAAWGGYQNRFGVLHIAAARAQGDYQFGAFGVGLRYALLSMDKKSGYLNADPKPTPATAKGATSVNARMGQPIHELTPALAWHVRGNNLKVVADLPLYFDCPTFLDPSLGVYAFPDPTAVDEVTVSGGATQRHTVAEARLLFQFLF
ncbi:MAG: hypothetical protein KGL53_06350 [Elusimicrobia bacterium]|nr:hypothetical protein [Elusimicrobiota bacterium]